MYADVEIATGAETPVGPCDQRVIYSGERQIVLIDKGEGRFEPRAVSSGETRRRPRESRKGSLNHAKGGSFPRIS